MSKKEIITTVQDILDLAESLKKYHHPDDKVVFADEDFNEYLFSSRYQCTSIGDALGLDEDTMEENGEDYNQKCLLITLAN